MDFSKSHFFLVYVGQRTEITIFTNIDVLLLSLLKENATKE